MMEQQVNQTQVKSKPLVHPMEEGEQPMKEMKEGKPKKRLIISLVAVVVIVVAGVLTGRQLAIMRGGGSGLNDGVGKAMKSKGGEMLEAGVKDEEQFPDKSEGVIEPNDGSFTTEGTHMLIRPGGESQTAYLTSSVVDLSLFEGKQVEVWGETFGVQTAGWFMDVGFVKVVE